jgi:hypothetical protein
MAVVKHDAGQYARTNSERQRGRQHSNKERECNHFQHSTDVFRVEFGRIASMVSGFHLLRRTVRTFRIGRQARLRMFGEFLRSVKGKGTLRTCSGIG